MTEEQKEDLKEILVCISCQTEELTKLINSMNKRLETEQTNMLKIQNQLSITNLIIPDTEREIEKLKKFIEKVETEWVD